MGIEIGPGWTIGGGISIVQPPGGPTAGWAAGGRNPSRISTVNRITFATDTATASVRGPLSSVRSTSGATGNDTDGWAGGGRTPNQSSTVDRITYATDTATASVRGPLSSARYGPTATGTSTNGWFGGGYTPLVSIVDRITFATDTATASVRGPLSSSVYNSAATTDGTTYGWFGGGSIFPTGPPYQISNVQRITYATDTNTATTRGPLSLDKYTLSATGTSTAGWYAGGSGGPSGAAVSIIDRITYATDTATASVRGPLSAPRNNMAASTDSTTYGWFAGGGGTVVSTVDRITYATDTNTATTRGPLSEAKFDSAGLSGVQ